MAKKRALPARAPRKLPTQERARRTYLAILQAGARILERHGYEALTTNHVADLAGVGIASLYEYFPNKQALVAEIVRHVLAALLVAVLRPPAMLTPEELSAALAEIVNRVTGGRGEPPHHRRAVTRNANG